MTRTILVTGGGTGIGRSVAAAFVSAGDSVIITGRRSAPLERVAADLGRSIRPEVCDSTDAGQVAELSSRLPETVDVLVHCAGGNTDFDRPVPTGLEQLAANWRTNLEANLISAVLMVAAVKDRLAPGGSVITIGSIAADQGSGAYGAAKAALASWNVGLAAELGARGATANVISPGYIADTEFFRDHLTQERRNQLIAATATGRTGTPDDIAATAVFLASTGARHITGQVLAVNGGARTTR